MSPQSIDIDIDNRQVDVPIDARRLQAAVRAVLAGEQVSQARIGIAVVDNPKIHDVNRRFLQHDCPTDVISFVLNDEGEPLEGDLMVSAEMAATVAADYDWPADDELLLYVIHGTLHLVGYDDQCEADRREMRARETHYLNALGIDTSPHREIGAP